MADPDAITRFLNQEAAALGTTKPDYSGKLKCVLVKADDLKDVDTGGESDPYVTFSLGMYAKKKKSKVIEGSCSPEWNQTFKFKVDNVRKQLLKMIIKDKDRFGKDDMLGSAKVPLNDLVNGVVRSRA